MLCLIVKLDAVSSSTLKPISEYAERGGSFREVKVPPSQTTVTIEGLEPYQQYEFVLHAVSALGKGHPTMPIEVQTAETVPGNSPTDVKARPLNSQAVLVQWGPPEIPNGKITGYTVYYTNKALTDEQDKTDWLKKETKAEELMATLSGLEYEKTYYIQVQAKNTKGSGPFSKTVTVITKQGVPGQPSKLIAKPVDSRRISLTWEKPLHSYNIIGYTIRFNVSDTETKELRLTSDIQRHTVDGLRADTLYSFRVAAHSDRGQGAFGDAVTARTLQSAAVVFPELQLSPRNSSKSLILQLKSPIENWNDTIEIEYRKAISEGSSEHYEDSDENEGSAAIQFEEIQPWLSFEEIAENPEIEINGLIPNTFYEVRIKAGTSRSDTVLAKTLEDGLF
uniref:Fibronectin type-III domain-containing protein n=1 Tax=Panagrolaimus davidi TaxID=227884 RepID=A0A914NYC7_9BILA